MAIQAISYGDTYVHMAAITKYSWKWRMVKLTILILIASSTIFLVLRSLLPRARQSTKLETRNRHFVNPCRHITPEPEIIFQEKFQSLDDFFPHSYKERKCVSADMTITTKDDFQTCFGNENHCVTRYEQLTIIRIPYPGNGTYAHWKIETDHVAVACECCSTQNVETAGIRDKVES